MTYHFSEEKRVKIIEGYQNGMSLRELGQKFECSYFTIRRILIEEVGLEKYKKIAKEHTIEHSRKLGQKYGLITGPIILAKWKKEHPEEQVERSRRVLAKWKKEHPEDYLEILQENGRKVGKLSKTKKQLKNFQSSWEDAFLEKFLVPNFRKYTIKRQHYLKGFNHSYDFAILELKVLIEIDSDYRHGHSGNAQMDKERIARDAEVDKWAKQNGWTIFRYNNKNLKKMGIT